MAYGVKTDVLRKEKMDKTIVIGLDGAKWDLLEPWIISGELPNLAFLIKNGVSAGSQSELPTVTCPNWKCYSTGKNPGKFGVFWWYRVDKKNNRMVGYNSRSFKSLEVFDYLSRAGYRVGVINMPTTYPPKAVNGFMIAGGPGCLDHGYTFPKKLEEFLRIKYNYRVHPKELANSREKILENLDEYLDLMKMRFQVAKDMLDEVDFLHITIFYINVLHHFFYDEEPTKKGWMLIDNCLGDFIRTGNNIILMSDHGTHPIPTVFWINKWLEYEKLLKIRAPYLIIPDKVTNVIKKLRILELAEKIPEKYRRKIRVHAKFGTGGLTGISEERIIWDESKAIGTGQGTVYLLVPENTNGYHVLRDDLIKKLQNLAFKNCKVAKKVFKKEDVYSGKYLDIAPDIVYEQGDHVYTAPGLAGRHIFESSLKWKAENAREGIFLAFGPKIKKGAKIKGVRIVDIAPTILHMFDVPIPNDIDGKVCKEIFEDDISARNTKK